MKPFLRSALLASACLLMPAMPALAAERAAASANNSASNSGNAPADDTASADSREEILVTGTLNQPVSSATGLELTPRETPQSVTVIDRQRIDDFALTNVNDLLSQTVGINVERIETDRTTFNSRGFDITNFQVDGIGLPLIWGIQYGDLDTALFDRVEAIRGANALMTGVGNPSATINYVRKRPTDDFRASFTALGGSWNQWRLEGDVSVPLSDKLAVRLIYAHDSHDSYLDYNHVNRNVYGAILRWNIAPRLTATVGYTRQDNHARGVLWGALPLSYTDGTRIDFPVSASTSADWTYWNVTDQTAFAELGYAFANGWSVKGIFTYKRFEENAKLLYAYGYPDRATGEGVAGMAGIYPSIYDRYLGDLYASGPLRLFGREHQLAFGFSTGVSDAREWENFSNDTVLFPAVGDWGRVQPVEPSFPGAYLAANYQDKLTRLYGAAHLNFTDRLKGVVGASAIWLTSTGTSYGADQARDNSKVSPYVGAVYDVTSNVSLYASFTDIFNPQSEVDIDHRRLDPARGTSIEGGIKSEWFGKRLYATASLFRAKQSGLATQVGMFDDGKAYYEGIDTTSEGFELELAGRVTDNWTLSGGYTGLRIRDQDGLPTRTWLPTKSLKLATTYAVPRLNDLKVGAQLRWQNRITYADSGVQAYGGVDGDVILKQNGYAVLDLMAGIDVLPRLRATVNVRNVTDTKYLGSLAWGQAFYAAPRSAVFSLRFAY